VFGDPPAGSSNPNPPEGNGSTGGGGDLGNQASTLGSQNTGNLHTPPHRAPSPRPANETGSNTQESSQGSQSSNVDEVTNLRNSVGQMQKDVSNLMKALLPGPSQTGRASFTSTSHNPYTSSTYPFLSATDDPVLGPWAALPGLFSETNPGTTLSLQPKRPVIADVVPGHIASHFSSCEYHIVLSR